jgi:hypothetical protein
VSSKSSARLAVFSLFFVHPNGAFYRAARQEAGKPQDSRSISGRAASLSLSISRGAHLIYHTYTMCSVFSLRAHPHTQTQQRKNCGCTRADAWTKAKNINNPQRDTGPEPITSQTWWREMLMADKNVYAPLSGFLLHAVRPQRAYSHIFMYLYKATSGVKNEVDLCTKRVNGFSARLDATKWSFIFTARGFLMIIFPAALARGGWNFHSVMRMVLESDFVTSG